MKFSGNIAVLVNHQNIGGAIKASAASQKLVQLARVLTSGTVVALCPDLVTGRQGVGRAAGAATEADLAAAELGQLGANKCVFPAEITGFNSMISGGVADFVQAAFEQETTSQWEAVFATSDFGGREVCGSLALRFSSAAISDISGISVQGGQLVAAKLVMMGSWDTLSMVETSGSATACYAFRVGVGPEIIQSNGVDGSSDETGAQGVTNPQVTIVDFELSSAAAAVQILSSNTPADGGQSLAEADVVVVGGRGTNGDFGLVQSLADQIGGAVGATRVACDEGWISREAQVGQTGATVAPKLYIGLGVSGAVHHTCGIQGAEKIVAICDDPDAPIFELADFGIVGDVDEVVPVAIAELKNLLD